MTVAVGRVVHYRLSEEDAEKIRHSRFLGNVHSANEVSAGDVYPAIVVRVNDSFEKDLVTVNLRVWLDGTDDYWATSSYEILPTISDRAGQGGWFWPDGGH